MIVSKTEKKKLQKFVIVLHLFEISLICSLIEGSWILMPASALNLLCYHMSGSLWKKPLHIHKTKIKNGKMISLFYYANSCDLKKALGVSRGPQAAL